MTVDTAIASKDALPPRSVTFPKAFVWGAATSAYQIEGATTADGRGESIWDRFTSRPGTIGDGTSGDRACEHYHRWEDRHRPDERARPRCLPILDRLAACRSRRDAVRSTRPASTSTSGSSTGSSPSGSQPWPTLYHWDLPQPLEDAGGWPVRMTAEAFADYTAAVVERLGDRVDDVDDPQRAVRRGAPRLRHGRARAGAERPSRRTRRRASPAARPRPRPRADPCSRARGRGRHRAQLHAHRRGERRSGRRRVGRAASTISRTAGSSSRSPGSAIRPGGVERFDWSADEVARR